METTLKNSEALIEQKLNPGSVKDFLPYVFCGLIIAVEIVVAILFLPQLVSNITSKTGQISQLKTETDNLSVAVNAAEGTDQAKLNSDLAKASQALPTEKKVSGIISSLTSLASSSGIVVNQLELTPCNVSTRSAGLRTTAKAASSDCQNVTLMHDVSGIPLSMELFADPVGVQGFVSQLYQTSPLLGIKTFEFTPTLSGGKANLTLLLYFQPVNVDLNNLGKISPLGEKENKTVQSLSSYVLIVP